MKYLLVIDMQKDFICGSLGTNEAKNIVKNVCSLIKYYKDNNMSIIVTQDTHDSNYLINTLEGKLLPIAHCIKDSWGWEIDDAVLAALGSYDKIVYLEKNTFGFLKLPSVLSDDADEIEICGLCTDICVISNALILRAAFPNIRIVIRENCCAGVTPEKHKAALEVMKSCQIEVI